jgi:PAS domain S-box-containing protein
MVVMPILSEDGTVVGYYEPVSEVTKQTLSERRMNTLLQLSECTSGATSLKDLWRRLLGGLKGHESDIYFAGLYSLQHETSPELSPQYNLEGAVGFGEDKSSFRSHINIYGPEQDGVIPALRSAHQTRTAVLLSASDGTLTSSILRRLERAGAAEAPRAFVVYPLSCSVDDCIEALMTIGISPTRDYDDDYRLFISLLARQVQSTITFVKLFEKEKDRLKQQVIYESELKFKQFAETAQVGIFNFDPDGNIRFCNEAWLELSGHDRNDMSAMSWTRDVHPDNAAEIKQYWDKIVNLEGPQTFEVQYKKPWTMNRGGDLISLDRTWVVASAYAEVSADGRLTGILGCVTDISSWKWVDQLAQQRLTEALELKRQQENFLDITSHEMRNPLNAILHCAAELIELLAEFSTSMPTDDKASVVNDCLDASRTIVYCGRHQKRIIDDVLTLSKLDSNLLSISPVETRPLDVVEEVLKVFDTELRASSIQTRTVLAESYKQSNIDTVLIDPHRVIQVLINLVANAIKFTKGESLRSLHIVLSALPTEPVSSDSGVRYVPSGRHREDPTQKPEWGAGNIIFLHFSVQDTGPGMSQQEADLLFNRFAQGSPRTHVQYGGSGLGLFISRELAELHGGRIGISSELGLGSTFDFYVKGRRSNTQTVPKPSTPVAPTDRKLAQSRRLSDSRPPPMSQSSESSPSVLQVPSSAKSIHVLIVEDNLINQKILAKLMRKHGYAVSITNHGEEALGVILSSFWHVPTQSASPKNPLKLDVVLADIEMPVMDGKAFVRTVREWQEQGKLTNDIPVIAVTGNARSEQIQEAKECGFDDVVSKPYLVQDLVGRIERFTDGGQRRYES